jgi:type VI secretion system secreted protein Hcp
MAYEFYVAILGTKQTEWGKECHREGHEHELVGFRFESAIASPRDPLTGQATGRRRHQPVLFRKRVGAASPQFAQALCTNELLKSVKFTFVRMSNDGTEEAYFSVTLAQATIASVRLVVPDSDTAHAEQDFFEEVTLTFQSITWEHIAARAIASDDWNRQSEGRPKAKMNDDSWSVAPQTSEASP